jgi:hypothetical protein
VIDAAALEPSPLLPPLRYSAALRAKRDGRLPLFDLNFEVERP